MDKAKIHLSSCNFWSRYDSYQISDGYVRPVPGSTLCSFDGMGALKDAQDPAVRIGLVLPPLLDKIGRLELEIKFEKDGSKETKLRNEQRFALLEWVRSFGLLGNLPHCCEYVKLAARWRRVRNTTIFEDRTGDDGDLEFGSQYVDIASEPMHRIYQRLPGAWSKRWEPARKGPEFHDRFPLRFMPQGELVPLDSLEPSSRGGTAHMRNDPLQNVKLEPIGEAWGKYFPSVPKDQRETFEYPEPLCPAFWKSYSEPVQEIIREVEDLYQAVAFFARPLAPWCMLWENAGAGLATTAAPAQRRLRIDAERDEVVAEWGFPSLLSMIAFNAIERVADRAVRLCERCHALFSSNDRTAKYCCKACREVQQKRNQREVKRKVVGGNNE